jgi:hypothetical protein
LVIVMKKILSTSSPLLVVVVLAAIGCGSGNSGIEKVVVSGTVTFDGTAIPNGEVRFYPIEGTKGAVSGGPIRDGAYIAQGKGGVPIGKHRVEIQGFRAAKGSENLPEGGPAEQYLPAHLNESSTLTAEITPDTEHLDFALTSK